jgi:PLP dependent protein
MATIEQNIQHVRARIVAACVANERNCNAVQLLAVTKTVAVDRIRQACMTGQSHFGENYVQEALEKIPLLADLKGLIHWHLIGALQSNKTRGVAQYFSWVHSLESARIAQRLNDQRPAELPPLNVCLQVNISRQTTKAGLDPDDFAGLAGLARQVSLMPRLQLRGLMAVATPTLDTAAQRQEHRSLHDLLSQLNQQGLELDTLSMGMSADLEAAIAEGSTWVRVGTAIFGPR